MKKQDLKERFLRRCPAPNDRGCIEWSGNRHKKRGYGRITVEGKAVEAHRMAWRIFVGEIPQGLNVLHKCDNPPCVNIEHLYIGTQADNVRDCRERNRDLKVRRLTPAQAFQIRFDEGTYKEIAARHGVSFSTVSKIKSNVLWRHVPLRDPATFRGAA